MKALNVFMIAPGPEPAAWAMARTDGKPAVMAAAAVMRRRWRRECIQEFHQFGEMPVERISKRDASPYSTTFSSVAVKRTVLQAMMAKCRGQMPSRDAARAVVAKWQRYSRAITIGSSCGVTAAEICDAIRKAANTAGTLTSLRN
jgi:hypothetical protein